MKFLYLLLFSFTLLNAQKVEISADSFEADEKKMLSVLQGNVRLIKGEDTIKASKLTIYFDAENKPKSYLAEGNINFIIHTGNQHFKGKAQKLLYKPSSLKYEISGNAFIHEMTQNRKLYGETIMIDRISGKSTIKGSSNKPIKFIFEVKEE